MNIKGLIQYLVPGSSPISGSFYYLILKTKTSLPGGSAGKESTYNARDLGSIPGLGRSPGGGHGHPLQYSCLENPHGQRSLEGYSPWGCKELDATGRLSMHTVAQKDVSHVVSHPHVQILLRPLTCSTFLIPLQ